MRGFRFTLAGIMASIVVIALGAVALKEATPLWAGLTFWLTVLALLGAVLHGAVSTGRRKAGLLGFALFGGAYLAIYLADEGGASASPTAPVQRGLESLWSRLHAEAVPMAAAISLNTTGAGAPPSPLVMATGGTISFTTSGTIFMATTATTWSGDLPSYNLIGQSLAALLFGLVGAFWAGLLLGRPRRAETSAQAATTDPLAGVMIAETRPGEAS